jgi:ankyrin repeat protein
MEQIIEKTRMIYYNSRNIINNIPLIFEYDSAYNLQLLLNLNLIVPDVLEHQNFLNNTPLMFACYNISYQVLETILNSNIITYNHLIKKCNNNKTILMYCCEMNFKKKVKIILECNLCDENFINLLDDENKTALDLTTDPDIIDMIKNYSDKPILK